MGTTTLVMAAEALKLISSLTALAPVPASTLEPIRVALMVLPLARLAAERRKQTSSVSEASM